MSGIGFGLIRSEAPQLELPLKYYDEVDVDGVYDEKRNIRYFGKATRQHNNKWNCLADVGGALCIVEVTITERTPQP